MFMPDESKDLHARVSVLEDWRLETRDILHGISAKLDQLATLVTRGSATACPAPGSCVEIRKEVAELRAEHKNTMARVMRLERWQVFLTGIAAAVAVIWALLTFIIPLLMARQ